MSLQRFDVCRKAPVVARRWTWNPNANPGVDRLLDSQRFDLNLCGQLEEVADDAMVGKVLCVCVAVAIARDAIQSFDGPPKRLDEAAGFLDLLDAWVDDPTDERFEKIGYLIFGDAADDMIEVVWWAARVVTSSVGNYEAGVALSAACDAAIKTGLSEDQICKTMKAVVGDRRECNARRNVNLEGYTAEEILALNNEELESFVFTGEPLVFRAGSAVILGEFRLAGSRLVLELAHIDGGGEGVLPTLSALADTPIEKVFAR